MKNKSFITACILTLFCLLTQFSYSQQCGNCKLTPKVTTFDFDVQVPKPNVADSTDQLWPEWKNLFILAGSVATNLKNNSGNCITFTMPPSTDTGDVQLASVGGETFTNLPSNPNISSNLSEYGDYLMTGIVKKTGDATLLHVEIQSSCGRKVVAAADVSFQLSSVAGNVNSIAQQAASQLSPLIDKIKKFELEERLKDKKLSLSKMEGDPIRITPLKKTLKAGESTDFTIELKDCDGVPLQGREILFTETVFEGLKIYGTMGGIVTPAKVITGADGKATARFTLKAGAKEAVINAYSPGNEVKGCKSMFIGDAYINIRKVYSGFVKYSFDDGLNCEEKATSESGVRTDHYIGTRQFKVTYNATFYIDEKGVTSFSGEDENVSATAIPNVMESGNMVYRTKEIRRSKVINNPPSEQVITKDQNGRLISGAVRFTFDETLPMVDLDLKFNLKGTSSFKQTYLPSGSGEANEEFHHSVGMFGNNLQYNKTTEGGKIKHTFTWLQTTNGKCTQKVERMQLQVIEE